MDQIDKKDEIHRRRSRFIPQGHASLQTRYVASASGAIIRDVEGREYIDFAGGIGVMNVGHSHPKVVSAIQDQAAKFTHTCFMILPYEPAVSLAEKLCAVAPVPAPSMALFINSGAEAVENAVKIARYSTKRTAIIACENAYHGRTLLTMSLTSKVKPYKFGFGPFASEIYHVPYAYCYRCSFGLTYPGCDMACADYLKSFFINHVASETVAALIAEPVQGEGGFMTPPPEYFPKIARICKENGILFHRRRDPVRHGADGEDVRHRTLGRGTGPHHRGQEPRCGNAPECRGRPGRDHEFRSSFGHRRDLRGQSRGLPGRSCRHG